MLQKQYRLPASTRLIRSQQYVTKSFTVRIASTKNPQSRFGFVVGKSVDKRATARNRIRRLLRSCVETLLPSITEGHDILFFPKREILAMKQEDLYNEVHTFFEAKHLLK